MSERISELANALWPEFARRLAAGGVAVTAGGSGTSDHGRLTGLSDDDHPQYLTSGRGDGRYTTLAAFSAHAADPAAHHALATAGNSGISVAGQAISLAAAAAGAGLGYAAGVLSINVAGLGLSVASDAVTLSSSSNPGAAAAILASDASGYLNLVRLVLSDRLRTPTIDTASGNLTLQPAGDITIDPVGNDVLPATNYDINLGALSKKYLTLHAAELWVETLVAQNTIATIGGRILVGPTTYLSRDMGTGDTTIYVRHNQMISGDRAYMEANGSVEFFAITSGPTTISATEYSYTVTRNLDGSGANAWYAGDAMFNTGQAGNGFIDLYSLRGVKTASQAGPTIVGNVRNSSTYNDWSEAWAIGNLNGLYGYGANTVGVGLGKYASGQPNIVIDPTNGVRLRQYTTDMIVLDPSGNSYFAGVMTIGTAGEIRQGTGALGSNYTGLRIWRDGSVGRIGGYNNNTLQWYGGTDGYLYGGAGAVAMMSYGFLFADSDFSGGGTWPFTYGGLHAVDTVSSPGSGYRGSLMYGIPVGVFAVAPTAWHFHYPGTLPANTPVGGGASWGTALAISDDTGSHFVWHSGNDGSGSGLDADTLDTYQASAFALLAGATFTGAVLFPTSTTMFANTSGGWTRDWVVRNNYAYGGAGSSYVGVTGTLGDANGATRAYLVINDAYSRAPYQETAGVHVLRSGNVGINTTAPATALEVVGTTTITGDLFSTQRFNASTVGEAAWTTVSAPSGYTTVSGFSHTYGYKKFGDLVLLRGTMRRTSGTVTTLMTLPAGYRPAAARRLPASASGSGVGAVDVNTDGTVVIVSGSPADYFSIDGVVFSL